MTRVFTEKQGTLKIEAANSIIQVFKRKKYKVQTLDWAVIALFAIAMLVIGYYYSNVDSNSDDYLVGGRNMNPWSVGLSLFATLFSTITYMAMPGEIIKHGPMILAGVIAFPFIILIVGWLIIPFIMKQEVTSAYEILEVKLGVSVRILGSFFFLALRLLWMGMIIFLTVKAILVPIMGIDAKYITLVSAILGVITVIYTSMGGLKAVILTDVIQSFVLFLGGVISISLFEAFGLKFLWITPCSMAVGVLVGVLLSLLPLGKKAPSQ